MSAKFNLKHVFFWMPLVVGGLVIGVAAFLAFFIYGPGRALWPALVSTSLVLLPGFLLSLALKLVWWR